MTGLVRLAPDPSGCLEAGRRLAAGQLVAFPTETVYGLGANATDPDAVARLFAAKGRPHFNPLIAHVPSIEAALALGRFDATAERIARACWPGPLTLVVPSAAGSPVSDLARAGLDTVAIRVPSHPVARAVLAAAGVPVAAPSANRSGHVSPTSAAHVAEDLDGRIDALVAGDDSAIGLESTILAAIGGELMLLRPGAIGRADLARLAGRPIGRPHRASDADAPLAPGRLSSHYAPDAPVRLDATALRAGEACLAFGGWRPDGADPALTFDLSPGGDPVEAAARLYGALRALDRTRPSGIAVVPLPREGIGEAIRDRLERAAAPRPRQAGILPE